MARAGRKITIDSIENKIEKQREILRKSKAKYEEDKAELFRLEKMREELQTQELVQAISKSKRSYQDILAYINGAESDELTFE